MNQKRQQQNSPMQKKSASTSFNGEASLRRRFSGSPLPEIPTSYIPGIRCIPCIGGLASDRDAQTAVQRWRRR
jgi:hypothetical protein